MMQLSKVKKKSVQTGAGASGRCFTAAWFSLHERQGLILGMMLQTGFQSIAAMCQLATTRQYQTGTVGQTMQPDM